MSKRKISVLIFSGLLVLGLTTFGLAQIVAGANHPAGQVWVQANIAEYRQTLAVSINPTQQALLQSKLERMERIDNNRVQGLLNVQSKPADICAAAPPRKIEIAAVRVEGIQDVDSAPISPEEFSPTNLWQGWLSAGWVQVYAGGDAENSNLGILWVIVENSADFGMYPAPGQGGALRIIQAQGARLTLENEAGQRLYFDLAARSYLSSADELVPTLVPLPTFSPAPELCP